MNEDRLTRRAMLAILVTGLITACVALAATYFVVGSSKATYTAKALVALVPGAQLPAADVPSYWESLGGGQAGRVAAEVFQQAQYADAAAQTIGVNPLDLKVTAGVVTDTSLINVAVQTTSAAGAEQATDKIIADAGPLVMKVAGPYELKVVQAAAGTAQPSSISPVQLYLVVFVGGLLVGAGAAIVARAKARSNAEPQYDSGEYTPQQGGYGRPAGGPPPRGPMSGANGAYGPPQRHPAGDQRPQPQQR